MRRLAIAVVLAAAPAWAQPGQDGTHKREGEYSGVVPGEPPPTDAKRPRPGPKTLGWIGFAAEDGAGELFFQAAQPFTVSQRVESGAVVVWLEGLTRLDRNARRPLDTRFFESPVVRVTAKPVKAVKARKGKPGHPAGVEIRVAMKTGAPVAEGVVRTETAKDGLFYAYLTFAGAAPSANQPAVDENHPE